MVDGVEKIVEALEPFYSEESKFISAYDFQDYMKVLKEALAYCGVNMYRDVVDKKHINGSDAVVELTQRVMEGAASHLILERKGIPKNKTMTLDVFSEFDPELKSYVPKIVNVYMPGHVNEQGAGLDYSLHF